eukprot:1266877-Prymnesium_polylepis.2
MAASQFNGASCWWSSNLAWAGSRELGEHRVQAARSAHHHLRAIRIVWRECRVQHAVQRIDIKRFGIRLAQDQERG